MQAQIKQLQKYSDDRIKLVRRKFNSGYGGIPRNDGMRFACGEYIFFMDADDLITKTAFEELYTVAENFDADVVYREKYFVTNENLGKNFKITSGWNAQYDFVKIPTLVSNNLEERLKDFTSNRYWVTVWSYFVRRDLILENDIKFIKTKFAEDDVFSVCIIFSAKKIVRVPYINYVYRNTPNSITDKSAKESVEKILSINLKVIFEGILFLDKFLQNIEFFQKNTEHKYAIFEFMIRSVGDRIFSLYTKVSPYELDELFRTEMEKYKNHSAVFSFLFNRMNIFNLNLIQQQQVIQQLQAQIKQLHKQNL